MSADVHTRDETDPIRIVLARALKDPDSAESQTLVKAVLSVISDRDEVTVAELCSLSEEMLGLLDAFARARIAGRYDRSFLEGLADRLRSESRVAIASTPLAA